jgi:copper chaperone CopZ
MKKVTFLVPTIKCGSCANKIKEEFEDMDSEFSFDIDVEKKEVHVNFNPETEKPMTFKKGIEEAGFQVQKMDLI